MSGLSNLNCISGKYITWTYEHFECRAASYISSFNETQFCTEAPYMRYIRKAEEDSRFEHHAYKKHVFHAIQNLYTNKITPVIITLNPVTSIPLHPISFGIPEDWVQSFVPPKQKDFGQIIPAVLKTYIYNSSAKYQEFMDDMSKSLFCITFVKAGWDCYRHVEILASGCVPLFINIDQCPPTAVGLHPKKLYELILKFPGLNYKYIPEHPDKFEYLEFNHAKFDSNFYTIIAASLLQYTRNRLTTKAVASYVLERISGNVHTLFFKFSIIFLNINIIVFL
jgi:hypothetical protein